MGKLKNSSEILYYANNYVRNNFFVNNEFEFINEKLIEKIIQEKGLNAHWFMITAQIKFKTFVGQGKVTPFINFMHIAFLITKNTKYYKVLNKYIDILLKERIS